MVAGGACAPKTTIATELRPPGTKYGKVKVNNKTRKKTRIDWKNLRTRYAPTPQVYQ